ncbi:MAG: hypothetical protein PHH45_02960 [Patescibacteria group bacterium]|jgi:hypothetical protein|nr:hypothetical protein [Patescibacteria group bacterium]
MKNGSRIILPSVLATAGVISVMAGRSGQVSADNIYESGSTSLYILLSATGFLLIAVAVIIVLFIIASGDRR